MATLHQYECFKLLSECFGFIQVPKNTKCRGGIYVMVEFSSPEPVLTGDYFRGLHKKGYFPRGVLGPYETVEEAIAATQGYNYALSSK